VTIVSRVTQHSDPCDNPTNGTSLINLKVLCPDVPQMLLALADEVAFSASPRVCNYSWLARS
jgi:hypothetical protein